MTTFTYDQLIQGISLEDAITELKGKLQDQGTDTTSWKSGDPSQTNLQLLAYEYSTMSKRNVAYINSIFNSTASGSGLTILSDSYFDNQRTLSQNTVGQIILSASGFFEFPQTWQPGELQVTDGTYTFQNVNQLVLNTSTNPLTGSFIAIEPGSDYNIASNSTLSSVETFVGLTITNPNVIGTTTWITTQGQDEEADEVLRQRNKVKWSSLQASENTIDRVKSLALSASSNIYYVSVDDTNPRGAGTVDIYLSKQTSLASEADATAVQAKMDTAFFGNSTTGRVSASLATQVEFSSTINVYYSPNANLTTVIQKTEAAVDAWIADIPIGGKNYAPITTLTNKARINDLITDIESINGVETIVITPNSDISLAKYEKLTKPSSYSSLITYTRLSTEP